MDFDAVPARLGAVGAVALADGFFVDGLAVGLAEGFATLPPGVLAADFESGRLGALAGRGGDPFKADPPEDLETLFLAGAAWTLALAFVVGLAVRWGCPFAAGFCASALPAGLAALPGALAPDLPFAEMMLTY